MTIEFQTKTENEYLRRAHAFSVKILACAFVAIVLIAFSFAGVIVYISYQHTERVKILMTAPVEYSKEIVYDTIRDTKRDIKQEASIGGSNSTINQSVGK